MLHLVFGHEKYGLQHTPTLGRETGSHLSKVLILLPYIVHQKLK
jgi:hypothetical protein